MAEPEQETEKEADYVLLGSITVTEYWEAASGERAIEVSTTGDLPLTQWLGQLRYAEHQLLADHTPDDDDDDD